VLLFQLRFEGVVGNDYLGDIAIDDVSVKAGTCNGQGEIFRVENQPYNLRGYGIRPVGVVLGSPYPGRSTCFIMRLSS
jgi:hypothetical protein